MNSDEMVWAVNANNPNDWFEVERAIPDCANQLFRCYFYQDSQNLVRTHYTYKTYDELITPNAYRYYHSVYTMREFEPNLDVTFLDN